MKIKIHVWFEFIQSSPRGRLLVHPWTPSIVTLVFRSWPGGPALCETELISGISVAAVSLDVVWDFLFCLSLHIPLVLSVFSPNLRLYSEEILTVCITS